MKDLFSTERPFFQLKNPSELLRLLLDNGRLEEAAQLAIEYAKAILGQGKDRFNLKSSLLAQNPPTWLPLNAFDLILLELEIHEKDDVEYKEVRVCHPTIERMQW